MITVINQFLSTKSFDTRAVLRVLLVLVGLSALAAVLSGGVFLQPRNLVNLVLQNAGLIIVTLGQFLVIVLAGIDLSVGAVMAVSSVLVVLFQDYGLVGSFAVALAGSLVFGLVNGSLVTFVRLPAFVVTLASMQIGYSVSKILSDAAGSRGGTVYTGLGGAEIPQGFTDFFKDSYWGVPAPLFVCVLFLILVALYLRTSPGHFAFATGGNERAAFLSGVPVWVVKMAVYIISSLLAGVAGILFVSRVGLGDPQAGTWIALDSIAAASIGGASLSGGLGTVAGTFIGVVILGVLNNIMNLLGVPVTMQPAVKGMVILLAVYLNSSRRQN
ncbi:MAG: ABC transporter permease [Anaerolineae bacterium]|nr:ABC transporter permease [Anaerolineae bacterium]